MKQKTRDERITATSNWKSEYFAVFCILFSISGCFLLIFMKISDIEPTLLNTLRFSTISYIIFMSLVLCFVIAFFKEIWFYRPIQRVGEAAKRVAEGDFSIRVAPIRKDGRKDQVELLIDDFNLMAEELNSIQMLKNDFVANVSHEFKSPLSVIQSYAAGLKKDNLTERQRDEYIDTIIDTSQRMSSLVTNILKLKKLEHQEIVPIASEYDLCEQLRCSILGFEDNMEKKNIAIIIDIPELLLVNYDKGMMEIIWQNLLSNAVKFTDCGGKIHLTLEKLDGLVKVSVSDTGCGINDTAKSHIFDQFYQVDTSRSNEGAGLGLALVKRVTEIVGGSISVDSKPGKGTKFTVSLQV